jgi:hypothetical protein
MPQPFFRLSATIAIVFLALVPMPSQAQKINRDDKGMVTSIDYVPIDAQFLNPSSPDEESAWWDRVHTVLHAQVFKPDGSFQSVDSRTYNESEKWSYPCSFWHILAGDVQGGMQVLQMEDAQANDYNEYTKGIDLWFGFTIVAQVPKYFFFGDLMTPDYRQRMADAIKIWTATNPQHTPHPKFLKYNPAMKDGWGPDRFGNARVDVRRTDAMWGFSITSIYLFAQASGNEATRLEAKDEILRYAWSLYHVGMGEWDSSTYMPYSIAPYLSLHAYATDPEVRMAAKMVLDYYHTAAALKYRHGLFSGTSKRDYGNAYSMYSGGFNGYFPMIFGEVDDVAKAKEHYTAYPMLAPYRPAPAMLALARRQLAQPIEVLAAKPTYESWRMTGDEGPMFFETLFLAKNYDLSSVVSRDGVGDVAPFRLVFDHGDKQAELFTATSGPNFAEKYAGDAIGQYRNLLVWTSPPSDKDSFSFALPSDINLEQDGGWNFFDTGKSWVAFQTFGLDAPQPQTGLSDDEKKSRGKDFGDVTFYTAHRQASSEGGFALIVAEPGDYASFDDFKSAVKAKAKLDVSKLADKTVRLTGTDGTFVQVQRSDSDLPGISRNGELRDWKDPKNWKLWQTVGSDLISLGWKEGELKLNAGSKIFTGSMKLDGWEKSDASPNDLGNAKNLKSQGAFTNQ